MAVSIPPRRHREWTDRGPRSPWPLLMLFLLLLALPAVLEGARTCSYNEAYTVANCSSLQLTFVPWGLHKSIITLDLSGNEFPILANQSFISYLYVSQLYLRNNSLHAIESRAFQTLQYLRMLDLSNNRLTQVPATALEPVSGSLIQLVLAGNKIYSLPKDIFSNLVHLKHLDLSGNRIYKVDYGAFAGLGSMEEFKIQRNALTFLPPDSFDAFPSELSKVQLYDIRWFCDCRMRWMWLWLNQTDSSVWDTPGYSIRCDGPSIVREKPLDELPLDELACEVQMKTSSSTRELASGANVTLVCKYSSIPEVDAKWLMNSEIIDIPKHPEKYSIESWAVEGFHGDKTQISELKVRNFKYEDIAKYECFVQNIRGVGSTEYRLTLEGVDFGSVTPAAPEGQMATSGVDTRSIVIAVAVVCGIILFIVIGILIFCSVNRMQKKKQEKRDAIRENVKQHFIKNSEVVSNGDLSPMEPKLSARSLEDQVDSSRHHHHPDDDRSTSEHTNDSNLTALKRPLDLDETEPLYIFEQPGSPFNNGNTYVSFGSELTDPGEFPPTPQTTYPRGGGAASNCSRYASSHAGSATPLLDRHTPSVFDSDEPVEDYAQFPVYDSLTNSLQHPHGEGVPITPNRNGSSSSYSSGYHRPYSSNHHSAGAGDGGAKRLSTFYYPPPVSANGSTPHTPGSTRSTLALMPKATDYQSEGGGGSSPRPESGYRGGGGGGGYPWSDYRDYRDMRYPGTTPPPHRMTASTAKSMSVGNLGYSPLAAAPRKPPRLFQSREYMELTPQDGPGDRITSPEAQQYSQSYGITPGTPV